MTELKVIAKIHTDFNSKFGLPRQSGIVEKLCGTIVFEPDYRNPDALRGIEGYSHLWLLWGFSGGFSKENDKKKSWSPTVRPPRLGGNRRMGVFATRSPNRPNPIGLSCVKLERIESTVEFGTVIHVSGIDMMNCTPIYDIKPYLPHIDAHPDAIGGFASDVTGEKLTVSDNSDMLKILPEDKREALLAVLREDPRPSYQSDENRVYGFPFAGFEISFRVSNNEVIICNIVKSDKE